MTVEYSNGSDITPAESAPAAATDAPMGLSDLRPKMKLQGTVKRLELYGAFIDVGVGVPGLIHISQIGTERVNRVADVLNVGDEVTVWVDKFDPERKQITLTMIEPLAVEWHDLVEGQVYTGRVTRLENFGVFVDIGAAKEGLVHISEVSHDYIKHPADALRAGDEVQVMVLGFNKRKRRIDLSIKRLLKEPEPVVYQKPAPVSEEEEGDQAVPTAMEIALREAMGNDFDRGRRDRDRRPAKKTRRSGGRHRDEQERILNRTLRLQEEGDFE